MQANMHDAPVRIRFSQGTLLLEAVPEQLIPVAQDVIFDEPD